MPIKRRYRTATSCLLMMSLLSSGIAQAQADIRAQQTGSVSGRVSDASGQYGFQGARISIDGLERTTSTDRDGDFRLTGVPAGSYTMTVEYLGTSARQVEIQVRDGQASTADVVLGASAAGADANSLDAVVVVGQLAGQAAALNRERNAINNIDVLSSDAIGDFPDENVAEALQRIPGLSVIRDQGEGRFVTIRGAAAQFNSTTINGLRVPGQDGRAVNLDVISSDLVESVEVSKSVTPDMDADAVGGNIEITTLTAFDLGDSLTVAADASYNEALDKTSPRASVTGTKLFSLGEGYDNFGVTASVNYFDRQYAVDNVESGLWPLLASPSSGEFRSPEASEQRDYELSRERIGGTLNFDYRPDDRSQYYLRTLFSRFGDTELELEHEYKFEDGDLVELSADRGIFEGAEVEKRGKKTTATREILSMVLGGENLLADWTLDYQLGYSLSSTDEPFSLGTAFIAEGIDIGYDLSGDRRTPRLFAVDPSQLESVDLFALDLIELESDASEESEISPRFNLSRDVFYGTNPGRIQFGAQARLRDRDADQNNTNFEEFDQDYTLAEVVGAGERDYPFGDFGPYVDTDRLREFYFANNQNFGINEQDFLLDSLSQDFSFDEDIFSVYAMTEVVLGDLELLGGVRVERTDVEQSGFRVLIDEEADQEVTIEPFSGSNSYTDFFPSLQGVYRISDQLHLRGGLTRTIARPSYRDARARQQITIDRDDDGVVERVANIGNPSLEPLYSTNADFELTYYPEGNLSAASIGVFYKDITDFFVETDIAGQAPFEDFDRVSQTVNGEEAQVKGVELSYVQQLGFLPAPWDGFLVAANYTYVDSEAGVPFRDEPIPLPEQSDHIANFSIGYENDVFSTRVAANYRGTFFDGVEESDDPSQDRFHDAELRVDFQADYRLDDNWTAMLNVTNLTDEPFYAYLGDPDYSAQFDQFGRTFELGLRAQF